MRRCSWCWRSSPPPRMWMLLQAEFLAIALVLVYVGAVMVLFLFVVMMLDINLERLREGFWSYLPLGGRGRRADGGRDGAGAGRQLVRPGTAAPRRRRAAGYSNTKELGPAAVHRLRLSVRDRRGDPAGGDRRGDRADHAPAQGDAGTRTRASRWRCARGPRARGEHAVGEARRLNATDAARTAGRGPARRRQRSGMEGATWHYWLHLAVALPGARARSCSPSAWSASSSTART